jgi:GT2 family glycosyltransferase
MPIRRPWLNDPVRGFCKFAIHCGGRAPRSALECRFLPFSWRSRSPGSSIRRDGIPPQERESHLHTIPEVTSLSVVVPATDRPPTLDECIKAIETSVDPPDEVIVIDGPRGVGPAEARNAGARRATGDVIVFVDSDVLVHRDTFRRIRSAFAADASLTGLYGSYDDDPRPGGIVSDFRNLLHHHVHQTSAGPAATFWAGIGAVRRDDFVAVGGFDEQSFPRPSIEDIDLGMRIVDHGGRIVLDPFVQGKHLKRWSLADMVMTDFAARGAPWVALLLRRGSSSTALNLGWRHRTTAAASLLLFLALTRRRFALSAGVMGVIVLLNHSFYRLLLRRRGATGLVAALPLHVVHHLVGLASVPAGVGKHLMGRGTAAAPREHAES